MDPQTQQFVRRASQLLAEASTDLGGVIAAPADPACAAALLGKIAQVRSGAVAADLVELARLAAEAEIPLERAVSAGRPLDRASLQVVGWAVQALGGALSAAAAGCAPLRAAA